MHGRAADLDPFVQNASMGVQPFECGEEGGVDIELTVPPASHEALAMKPHETGVAEQLDAGLAQLGVESVVEGFARVEVGMVNDQRGNETGLGAQQALRARHVRHHENDPRRIVGGFAGVDQRLEVRASAGDQNGDTGFGHAALRSSLP
jgi:hypothetical protein